MALTLFTSGACEEALSLRLGSDAFHLRFEVGESKRKERLQGHPVRIPVSSARFTLGRTIRFQKRRVTLAPSLRFSKHNRTEIRTHLQQTDTLSESLTKSTLVSLRGGVQPEKNFFFHDLGTEFEVDPTQTGTSSSGVNLVGCDLRNPTPIHRVICRAVIRRVNAQEDRSSSPG